MKVVVCLLLSLLCISSAFSQEPTWGESIDFLRSQGHTLIADTILKVINENSQKSHLTDAMNQGFEEVNLKDLIDLLKNPSNKRSVKDQQAAEKKDKKDTVQLLSTGQSDDSSGSLFFSYPFTDAPGRGLGGTTFRMASSRTGDFMRYPYASVYDLTSSDGLLELEECGDSGSFDPTSSTSDVAGALVSWESAQVADDVALIVCDAAPEYPIPINSGMCIPSCVTGNIMVTFQDSFRRQEACLLHKKMQLAAAELDLLVESANHVQEMRRFEIERLIAQDKDLIIFMYPYYAGGGRLDTVGKLTRDLFNKFQKASAQGASRKPLSMLTKISTILDSADVSATNKDFDTAFKLYKTVFRLLALT